MIFSLNHISFKRFVSGVLRPQLGTGNAAQGSRLIAAEMQVAQPAERYSSSCAGISRDMFAGAATGAGPLICAMVGNGVSVWPP